MTLFRRLFAPSSVVALIGVAAILASCSRAPTAICPRVAVLNQASKLVKFAPDESKQPGDIMYVVEITGAKIQCTYTGDLYREMESTVNATIIARKGPKMQGDSVKLAYFIVVTDRRGTVLTKKEIPLTINFGGRQSVQLTEGSWQLYDLRKGGSGAQYETWLGFQLTDEQLQFNRTRAAR